ncbi:MAG: hypothetical protein IJO54_06935 [Oscillospiraceae bacterium]|nr:hypothetical protein [Oscillospiraceae bacterium]
MTENTEIMQQTSAEMEVEFEFEDDVEFEDDISFEAEDADFEAEDADFEAEDTDFEAEDADFEAEDTDFEAEDTDFEAEDTVLEAADGKTHEAENETADGKTEKAESEATADGQQAEQTDGQQADAEEMYPEEFEVLGEKRQVKKSEVNAYIAKGLAYAPMKERYMARLKEAYADPRIAFVEQQAAAMGVDAHQYMAQSRMQAKHSDLVQQFGGEENLPEDVKTLLLENAQADREKTQQLMDRQQYRRWEEEKLEEYDIFMENHPEITHIPQEIMHLAAGGESLEGAFAITQLAKAQQQLAALQRENSILKQNSKNSKTTLPTSRGSAVREAELEWEF